MPKETLEADSCVALRPVGVAALTKIGFRVAVEAGAGEGAKPWCVARMDFGQGAPIDASTPPVYFLFLLGIVLFVSA